MAAEPDAILSPPVDAATLRAARRLLALVGEHYPVREGYLFGSRARGTHRPDSDADVAVVLRGAKGDRGAAVIDMAGVAFEVMMDMDVHIQVVPLWGEEFDDPEPCTNPRLVLHVRRDGIKL